MTNKHAAGLTASVVAMLIAFVPLHEGKRLIGYRDPAGIATKCFGDTRNVVVGQRYSEAECLASLKAQLAAHGDGVLACVPSLAGHDNQTAAAVSFAYNIGTGAFCKSTVAKRFNAGDWRGACRAMNQKDNGTPQYVTAVVSWKTGTPRPYPKYRVLGKPWAYVSHGTNYTAANIEMPGLVTRRAAERALCEKGL